MMKKTEVLNAVSELKAKRASFKEKCRRNLSLYEDTLTLTLDDINTDYTVGFYKNGNGIYDTTSDMSINVIKSCIDTLASKIASTKVRPFFNTVNGSFKDVVIARHAQHYFDQSFDYKNINKEVVNCFRNSAIFDTGILYVNPKDHTVRNVLPWQVFYRPAESVYGKITRIYYERKQYPTSLIPGYSGKENYIAYGEYYDINNHVHAELFSDGKVIIHEYDADVLPFVIMNYNCPIASVSCNSIVDMLLSIQLEINSLANTVKDASQLTPANTILIPTESELSVRKMNNGIGNVIKYSASGTTSSPVTVATPSFVDPQYITTIKDLKEIAYEMVGISQLSATSQKPQGLDSGAALATMENIESDRFEVQLNQVIRTYTELARVMIKVFDPNENILPEDKYRANITWRDIYDEEKKMKIQFSSADALSKDPSTKLQILQSLAANGIIPASIISKFLEIPDLEKGFSVANNSWEACQTVIMRCIEDNIYEVPSFVPFSMLLSEILNTQMLLFNADAVNNQGDIEKLGKLFMNVYNVSQKMNEYLMQQQQPAMEEQPNA